MNFAKKTDIRTYQVYLEIVQIEIYIQIISCGAYAMHYLYTAIYYSQYILYNSGR